MRFLLRKRSDEPLFTFIWMQTAPLYISFEAQNYFTFAESQ